MLDWLRQIFGSAQQETSVFVTTAIVRLVAAAILGGAIGLERELKSRPAGLRTNMFICFGAALFTILSVELAKESPGDHTRVAAQIIPGIGFIGAGSILHSRGSVQGLTTAATVFVVASVGMAVGGGLYLTAIFATLVILLALFMLGRLEDALKLKSQLISYEVTGDHAEAVIAEVNRILDAEHQTMQTLAVKRGDGQVQINFTIDATRREHVFLLRRLQQSQQLRGVSSLAAVEHE
jgi:putative Mg2+ transporter-C (MgtC) family protein